MEPCTGGMQGAYCTQGKGQAEAAAWEVSAASTYLGAAAQSFVGEIEEVGVGEEAAFAKSVAVVGSGDGKAGTTYWEWEVEEHLDTSSGVDQPYEVVTGVEEVAVGGVGDEVVCGEAGGVEGKEFVSASLRSSHHPNSSSTNSSCRQSHLATV